MAPSAAQLKAQAKEKAKTAPKAKAKTIPQAARELKWNLLVLRPDGDDADADEGPSEHWVVGIPFERQAMMYRAKLCDGGHVELVRPREMLSSLEVFALLHDSAKKRHHSGARQGSVRLETLHWEGEDAEDAEGEEDGHDGFGLLGAIVDGEARILPLEYHEPALPPTDSTPKRKKTVGTGIGGAMPIMDEDVPVQNILDEGLVNTPDDDGTGGEQLFTPEEKKGEKDLVEKQRKAAQNMLQTNPDLAVNAQTLVDGMLAEGAADRLATDDAAAVLDNVEVAASLKAAGAQGARRADDEAAGEDLFGAEVQAERPPAPPRERLSEEVAAGHYAEWRTEALEGKTVLEERSHAQATLVVEDTVGQFGKSYPNFSLVQHENMEATVRDDDIAPEGPSIRVDLVEWQKAFMEGRVATLGQNDKVSSRRKVEAVLFRSSSSVVVHPNVGVGYNRAGRKVAVPSRIIRLKAMWEAGLRAAAARGGRVADSAPLTPCQHCRTWASRAAPPLAEPEEVATCPLCLLTWHDGCAELVASSVEDLWLWPGSSASSSSSSSSSTWEALPPLDPGPVSAATGAERERRGTLPPLFKINGVLCRMCSRWAGGAFTAT